MRLHKSCHRLLQGLLSDWNQPCIQPGSTLSPFRLHLQGGNLQHEDRFTPGSELQGSQTLPVGLSHAELDQLFASCLPKLAMAARRMMRNPQDSEDILQDGLLSAFENLDQFEGRSKFSTWLHTIVRNAAKMHVRKASSRPLCSLEHDSSDENGLLLENVIPDLQPNPEQICSQRERSRILRTILRELPSRYQCVIQLCDIEGLEGKDAAAKLGMSLNSLKTCLHRARRLVSRKIRHRCQPKDHYSPDQRPSDDLSARHPNFRCTTRSRSGRSNPASLSLSEVSL